jgi:hypothetical protein
MEEDPEAASKSGIINPGAPSNKVTDEAQKETKILTLRPLAGGANKCLIRAVLNAIPGPRHLGNRLVRKVAFLRLSEGRSMHVTSKDTPKTFVTRKQHLEHFKRGGVQVVDTKVRQSDIIKHVCSNEADGKSFVAIMSSNAHCVAIRGETDSTRALLIDPSEEHVHELCEDAFKNCTLTCPTKLLEVREAKREQDREGD